MKVRITSNDSYALGSLWIFDVVHLPVGLLSPYSIFAVIKYTVRLLGVACLVDRGELVAFLPSVDIQ